MSVAVVTDATSPGFAFPLWHKYYSAQFGSGNLFVLTYGDADPAFDAFELGGLERAGDAYSDDLRIAAMADLVARLLKRYEAVVRVDVDEFLVVDPQSGLDLRGYVSQSAASHVTARGFDLIPDDLDAALDLDRPVLAQRRLAFALTALNKTCVTRQPLRWGRGFHYCSLPPALDRLLLFHLKRVDPERQRDWAIGMAARFAEGSFEAKYYRDDLAFAENFLRHRQRKPCVETENALDRDEFNAHFLSKIRRNPSNGLFEGPYDLEETNVRIPKRFESLF